MPKPFEPKETFKLKNKGNEGNYIKSGMNILQITRNNAKGLLIILKIVETASNIMPLQLSRQKVIKKNKILLFFQFSNRQGLAGLELRTFVVPGTHFGQAA